MILKKIRILFIEDNEDDFALVFRELKRGKFEIEYELTQDEKGFLASIEKKWDIIVSDYSLPSFNGYEALKICNDRGIDIPFIIVSGTVGEDIAVDMMKAGAKDYIMKKSLKRLLPAVERELADAQIRKRNKLIALEREVLFTIGKDLISTGSLDELLEKIHSNIKKVIYAENFFIALHNPIYDEISFQYFTDKFEKKPLPRKKMNRFTEFIIRSGKSYLLEPESLEKLAKEKSFDIAGRMCESVIGIPLIIHSKSIGAIVVQSYEKDKKYNEFEKNFLEAIASDVAIAIERKQSEDAIRESEMQLTTALRIANAGHWEYDVANNTFTFNDNFFRIFKTTAKEVGGYKMSPAEYAKKFLHPDDMDLVRIENEAALNTNDPNYNRQLEHRIIFPNGEVGYISVIFHIEKDASGKTIRTYGINQDITERKKSEEALRESEERYRVFINSTNDMAFLKDESLKYILVNDANAKFFNKEIKEIIGKDDFDLMPEKSAKNCRKSDTEALKSDYVIVNEETIGERIYETHKFKVPLTGGKFGIGGYIRDVTERKWADENLRKSEEHYRTLLTAIPDLMFRMDSEGRFIDYHVDDVNMLFAPPEKFIGKHYKDILPQNIIAKYEKIIKKIKKTGEIGKFEYEGLLPNNELHYYEARVTCYGDECVSIIRDITERKKADEALKESEERYRMLIESMSEGVLRGDERDSIMYANRSACRIFGYEREELMGKIGYEILVIDEDRKIIKEKNKLRFKSVSDTYEVRGRKKTGEIIWLSINGAPIKDEKGNVIGSVGIFSDITERKKSEEALKASQERYVTLIETMNEGLILVDNDDVIQFVNKRECDIFGYEPEELIGRIGYKIMIAEEDQHIILEKNKKRQSSVSDSYEVRAIKKNGEKIWININGAPVKDVDGKVIGSVGIITDITERKQADEELKKLSRAVEQSPASVVITDVNGNIEYVNPKFVSLTGYMPEEVIGGNPRILKSGKTSDAEYKKLWDTIISGKDWIGEFQNKKKNGEIYWESAIISPVKNTAGDITHFLAIKEDITEKKLKEMELIKAKLKAEESERLKSSFLANMSHELRTPMVGILGFAELMKDLADNPELQDFADNITKSGKRLLETLNLILDLSRIEAGKLEIKTSEVNISQIVKEVYENYVPEAEKKRMKIKFSTSSENIICKIDERMLWESINNLINNALKYTKAGEVNVSISTDSRGEKVYIKVKDTGIGIPKESFSTIFEEFRQVSEGYSRGFEGTGLGLTITKNFIEKNGGKISVESEIGLGSEFIIELPVFKIIESKSEAKLTEDSEKIITPEKKDVKILCVDDDSFTREYISYILKSYYNLFFAENGNEAIEMAKSEDFSLILMDINLGKGMDGIETARKINKLPGYDKTPVIALTAFAMKGDREEFLKNGMKNYVSKPFKSNELIKIIEEVISNRK